MEREKNFEKKVISIESVKAKFDTSWKLINPLGKIGSDYAFKLVKKTEISKSLKKHNELVRMYEEKLYEKKIIEETLITYKENIELLIRELKFSGSVYKL